MATAQKRVSLTVLDKESRELVGGFSKPSKMPWLSYSLPSSACKVGSALAKIPGTTCHGCYTFGGNYNRFVVQKAMADRLDSITDPNWEDRIVHYLTEYSRNIPDDRLYFRWHDSGDIQSLEHLRKISNIATRLPDIRFWIPTREIGTVSEYLKIYGSFPWNLCVRVSAAKIDTKSPPVQFGLPVSTVHTDGRMDDYADAICPASQQDGKCGDCRSCWNNEIKWVSYPKH